MLQTGTSPDVFIGVLSKATTPISVSCLVSALAKSGHSSAVPALQAVPKDSTLAGKFRDQYPTPAEQARAALGRIQKGAAQRLYAVHRTFQELLRADALTVDPLIKVLMPPAGTERPGSRSASGRKVSVWEQK